MTDAIGNRPPKPFLGSDHLPDTAAVPAPRHVGQPRTKRRLLLIGGAAGTGKSTVARTLAARLSATWLQLDTLWIAMRDAAPQNSKERALLDIDQRIRAQAEPAEVLLDHHIAASEAVCAALPWHAESTRLAWLYGNWLADQAEQVALPGRVVPTVRECVRPNPCTHLTCGFVVAGPGYADLMADADEAAGRQSAATEPPSSELVEQRHVPDAEDDVALIQHEMEFASAERLAFFSDAVVAIALTLLALELPVPGGIENPDSASVSDMIRDAARHIDDYLAFLISFLVISAHWRLHHRVFRYVRHATRAIIRLNLYWLLLIVITPFTTKTLSIGHQNILRFGLYAFTQAMQFAIFAVIVVLIIRTQHVPAAADLQRLQSALWQTVAMAIGFAVSIPLYLLIGQRAFAVWALAPLVINLILRPRLRRRHPRAT